SYYEAEPELQEALCQIGSGFFCPNHPDLFKPLVDALLSHDYFMLLADWRSYVGCQERISQASQNPENWTRLSILNVARIGYFSSDRAISEYCDRVWNIRAVKVSLKTARDSGQVFSPAGSSEASEPCFTSFHG